MGSIEEYPANLYAAVRSRAEPADLLLMVLGYPREE
jgi:hypothetical protein